MTNVFDVPADALIHALAPKLAENPAFKPPEWSAFVTTGIHRERPPTQKDWWHVRVAAVLRFVYTDGPIGTERLSAHFGGTRDRGSKPNRAKQGSRHIARTALQQLEAAGFIVNVKGEGRKIAGPGQKLVDNTAHDIMKTLAKEIPALAKY